MVRLAKLRRQLFRDGAPMVRFPADGSSDGEPVGLATEGPWAASADGSGMILVVGQGRYSASLGQALEGQGHHAVTFSRFSTALREMKRIRPDTVLVGTDPAAGDPFEFLEELRRLGSPAVKIYLSDCLDPDAADRALLAGAHDLVCPPHSASSILMRRRVLMATLETEPRRDRHLRRRVELAGLTVDLTSRQVMDGSDPLTLSGREFELLVRLMESAGTVVARGELIRDIWGSDQGSEAVLDATVHRLRRKLEEKLPDTELVTTVRGVGYRLEGVEEGLLEPALQG